MAEFRVVDEQTDLTNAEMRKLSWDVVLSDGRAYDVYDIPGYVHTEGGRWGENSYYACPRGEKPTNANLILFDADKTCRWGFTVTEHSYTKHKWNETYITDNVVVTILRNDKPFKDIICNDMAYGVACAMKFITEVCEGPVDVNHIDWEKSLVGRKIWFEDTPAIVARVCNNFEMYIVPDNDTGLFPKPASWTDWTDEEWNSDYGRGMSVDIDSNHIHWFRDLNENLSKAE